MQPLSDHQGSRHPVLSEVRQTLTLAGPMVATMVAVMAMETVDALMIGRLGEAALAAAALAVTALFVFLLFGMGLLGAVSSLTAQAVAVGDMQAVRRSARQGLWIGLILGVPFSVALLYAEPVFIMLGQRPDISVAAQRYLDWLAWSLIPVFLNIPMRLTMASYGVTRPSMLIAIGAVPFNALFNWIFMFGGLGGPEMGLAGAGLATLLAYSMVAVATGLYLALAPQFRALAVFSRIWRPDWPRFRRIMVVGTPIGAAYVMEHGLFGFSTLMMGWVGVTELAAHQIAMQILSIVFMVPFGLSQAATIRIGLAAGVRDMDAVRLRGWIQVWLTVVFMAAAAALFWLYGDVLIGVFLSSADPSRDAVVSVGAGFLIIACFFQLFDGLQSIGAGMLRGLNDTVYPMIFAFVGYWTIGLVCAYYWGFTQGLGGDGIWYGMLIGLAVTSTAVLLRFYFLSRSPERGFRRLEAQECDPPS